MYLLRWYRYGIAFGPHTSDLLIAKRGQQNRPATEMDLSHNIRRH